MADRVVSVKVKADVTGAVSGFRKVRSSLDDLSKADLQKPRKAFDGLATKGALVGGLVAVGIGKAISSFAEFDAAMSGVAANSGATGDALNALRETAIKLGSDTQFSATEAAQGINELAKAGVSTADIMNGGIKGALDLAAAGQISVAEAAETTASALNQFQQDGSQAVHVADLLSNAANAAQGGVSEMGQALGQAGVAAHSAGLNIDETTTLLALFAKAGLVGSDAGTSLKTMMQRLSAPTDAAAATLESLGIAAYDAGGNFIGAEALLKQMSAATKDLSTQQRSAAFNTIFGTDAIRAASIAASAGADGYAAMSKEVTKAGGAAENAAKLTDNLKGDIERLGGALDTAFIQGGSAANGALRTLVQGLGGVVDIASKIPAPVLLAGAALGGIALTLPKGLSVYRDFKNSLDTLGISFDKIAGKAPRAAKGLALIGKAAGTLSLAAAGVYAFAGAADRLNADKLGADLLNTSDGLGLINKQLAESSSNGWGRVGSDIDSFGKILGATFDPGVINNIDNAIGSFKTIFGGENVSNIQNAAKQLAGVDQAMASLVAGGHGDQAKAIFQEMARVAADQGISVDQLTAKLPQYAGAIANAGNAAATAGPQMDGMSEDVKAVEKNADDAKKALDDLKTTLEGFGSPLAAQRAAQRDFQSAVEGAKDAVKSQTDELVKQRLESKKIDPQKATKAQIAAAEKWAKAQIAAGKGLDLTTEKGRANQAALDGIRDKTLSVASSTFELTKNSKLAEGAVASGRAEFIKAGIQMGLSAKDAADLATNMGLVPKDVATAISLSGVDTANTQLDKVTGKLTNLGKKTAKPEIKPFINKSTADAAEARIDQIARQRSAFISISAGLTGAASGLLSGISGVAGSIFKRATGGPIGGIGTATSDSNLALLSRGEHVLTAAEVAAAGGHGAIFALRKAILTGGVAFRAQGGPIATPMSSYRPAPPAPFRVDLGALANSRGGDTFNMTAIGADADHAVQRGVRDIIWKRDRS